MEVPFVPFGSRLEAIPVEPQIDPEFAKLVTTDVWRRYDANIRSFEKTHSPTGERDLVFCQGEDHDCNRVVSSNKLTDVPEYSTGKWGQFLTQYVFHNLLSPSEQTKLATSEYLQDRKVSNEIDLMEPA